jgi:hypothetical protein
MAFTNFFSKLTGRFNQRVYIRVRLRSDSGAGSVEDD